ncbi:hypothetical protein IF1G_04216 [Cordyceps javanica]|uniref:Uncharacterized protein n=1 Tax=Cordyceps javanica TaxID=43265 RepID=A0A545V5J2_9HYPO|nr:hypothetical protein IF1G_04216 [Cordyceps javanica]TQW08234.1 hypothetical protein IF2G_04110 [Cordyceps javanica]
MPARLGTPQQGNSSHTLLPEETEKVFAEVVHTENIAESTEISPQQVPECTSQQLSTMVLDAFDSASTQLHTATEGGIADSVASPDAETVTSGSATGPQSPKLVENTTTPDTAQTKLPKKKPQTAEPQVAARGSYLYLPGLGFVYQEDGDELGEESAI